MSRNRLTIAKNAPDEKLYQKRARAIFPILVRQAVAGQKISYGDLGEELNLHHRVLRTPLGCIGDTLLELGKQWQEEIPPIQGLVVNQKTGLPGDNVNFLRHFISQKPDSRQKEAIVNAVLGEVFSYPKWSAVLEELGLSFPEPLKPQLVLSAGRRGGPAESKAHKRLKDYIANHPRAVELNRSLAPGKTEYRLPSGDIPDVLFQSKRRHIAVEVKSHISDEDDLTRGLFQCVKYRAILRACRSLESETYEADALLAIEGSLPKELIAVKNTLGIQVIENIQAGSTNSDKSKSIS